MIVENRPYPDSEGNFKVQVLEEYYYNGKYFNICTERLIPARLIDFNLVNNGYEAVFDNSYLMELEWESRSKGCRITVYPKFVF